MELAHPPSVTVGQITSQSSKVPCYPRSTTYLPPWPKLKPTQRCHIDQLRVIHHQPPQLMMGHDLWAQRKISLRNVSPLVPCATGAMGSSESGPEEEDKRTATETGLKLGTEVKNRNVQAMGKHIEFVIHPAPYGGMNVGVALKLEWDKTFVPLGKGYSFYTYHAYQGRAIVRDAEMFIEPVINCMQPILLSWTAIIRPIVGRVYQIIKHKRTRAFIYCLITVVIISTLVAILKRSLL